MNQLFSHNIVTFHEVLTYIWCYVLQQFVYYHPDTGNPGGASAIYSATYSNVDGSDPLIFRPAVGGSTYLRTEANDKVVLLGTSHHVTMLMPSADLLKQNKFI